LLKDELVTNEVQHDLDKLGIAKELRGREETRARDAKAAVKCEARGPQRDDLAYNVRAWLLCIAKSCCRRSRW